MRREQPFTNILGNNLEAGKTLVSRKAIVAAILVVALLAFELFNFDTTQFALTNLLGEVRFAGVMWATILAIAFCAIDFAGLVRIFTPEKGREEPKAVWFLTGAWFLGTLANAIMTWWAVSLTLLNHDFGNEVLGREQLLRYVPLFVAGLVWLTRILFIGAFSVAGEEVFDRGKASAGSSGGRGKPVKAEPVKAYQAPQGTQPAQPAASRPAAGGPAATTRPASAPAQKPASTPAQPRPATTQSAPRPAPSQQPAPRPAAPPPPPVAQSRITYEPVDDPVVQPPQPHVSNQAGYAQPERPNSRIRQRPPMPGATGYPSSGGLQAQPGTNGETRRL